MFFVVRVRTLDSDYNFWWFFYCLLESHAKKDTFSKDLKEHYLRINKLDR